MDELTLLDITQNSYDRPAVNSTFRGFTVGRSFNGQMGGGFDIYYRPRSVRNAAGLDIIVVFRGTEHKFSLLDSIKDWRNNLKFLPVTHNGIRVHGGFLSLLLNDVEHHYQEDSPSLAKRSMFDEVEFYLKYLLTQADIEAKNVNKPFYPRIYVTGHSQGGALAQLYHWLSSYSVRKTVTWASPKVFHILSYITMKQILNGDVINHRMIGDPVPYLPPAPFFISINSVWSLGCLHRLLWYKKFVRKKLVRRKV